TATVEAIPLIVSSIISKKAAEGLDALVIDVKTGSGAFMRKRESARALARALVATGNSLGIVTQALITNMDQPLGRSVGNSVEVRECIALLRGDVNENDRPVLELSVELAARMVALTGIESSIKSARARILEVHKTGAALECFRKNVEAQGGDPHVCDEPERVLPLIRQSVKV